MMSSDCALVIWLDEIIEELKGLDWVKKFLENQYPTSTNRHSKDILEGFLFIFL